MTRSAPITLSLVLTFLAGAADFRIRCRTMFFFVSALCNFVNLVLNLS